METTWPFLLLLVLFLIVLVLFLRDLFEALLLLGLADWQWLLLLLLLSALLYRELAPLLEIEALFWKPHWDK